MKLHIGDPTGQGRLTRCLCSYRRVLGKSRLAFVEEKEVEEEKKGYCCERVERREFIGGQS